MSLPGARIYDLDENPVDIKNWWELENVLTYYEFFKQHEALFEDAVSRPKPEKKEEPKNIRRPLGSSWLMMNRTELAHVMLEENYSPLIIKKIWGLVDALPDLEKEPMAAHILAIMETAPDEEELVGLLEGLTAERFSEENKDSDDSQVVKRNSRDIIICKQHENQEYPVRYRPGCRV